MRPPTDIVRAIRQTEKGTRLAKYDQYLVDVAVDANKVEIREAVERLEQRVKEQEGISQISKTDSTD